MIAHLMSISLCCRTLILLVGVFTSAACTGDEIRWTEEVQLHGGQVVHLKRRTEVSSSGFPVQRRGFRQYNEFCYPPLGAHWKSKAVYRPQVFDIVEGKAYVKVPISGCTECMLHEYPPSDALYFVWESNRWKRIEEQEFPSELSFNLLSNDHANDRKGDPRGLVTLNEKHDRDASIYLRMKTTGRVGPHKPGACERCKSVRVRTDKTAEIFIPSSTRSCNW